MLFGQRASFGEQRNNTQSDGDEVANRGRRAKGGQLLQRESGSADAEAPGNLGSLLTALVTLPAGRLDIMWV